MFTGAKMTTSAVGLHAGCHFMDEEGAVLLTGDSSLPLPPLPALATPCTFLRRRSDYVMGFNAPAISRNKSKNHTGLLSEVNCHTMSAAKFGMKNSMASHTTSVFHSNLAADLCCNAK